MLDKKVKMLVKSTLLNVKTILKLKKRKEEGRKRYSEYYFLCLPHSKLLCPTSYLFLPQLGRLSYAT